MVLICFKIQSCMANNNSPNKTNNSNNSSKMAKSKKNKGLKIYSVDITSEKVERDADSNDSFITLRGDTDAPNGSIVYVQQKGNADTNLGYGGNGASPSDTKVKNHHIKILLTVSQLFDLVSSDAIKVGQITYLKIFCTNQNFDYSMNDSEFISKKVRKKLADSDIESYPLKATRKMVHIAEYD